MSVNYINTNLAMAEISEDAEVIFFNGRKNSKDNTNKGAKKGSSKEVYPFKTKEEIDSMIKVLGRHVAEAENLSQEQIARRNKLIFIIGINVGIRASDLRMLKWSFFFEPDGTFKEHYVFVPKKQRKYNKTGRVKFNGHVKKAVMDYVKEYPVENLDEYLFKSRKGNKAISEDSICRIVKSIAKEAGITQNIGSHSLRKTAFYWAWHNAVDKSKALVIIQQILGHSSTLVTQRYIGIMDDEIDEVFDSIQFGV